MDTCARERQGTSSLTSPSLFTFQMFRILTFRWLDPVFST